MLGLLPGKALVCLGHLGIALAVGLTAHGQVHAHLGTLTHKVSFQALKHLFVNTLGHTDHMLVGKRQRAFALFHLYELRRGNTALGAFLGSLVTGVHITANSTSELFHHLIKFKSVNI